MTTATYADYILRYPASAAPQETVEAFLADAAAEISARCGDRGTTYAALVANRGDLVRRVECDAAYRRCGRAPVDGVQQNDLKSFSQSVGDHRWEFAYSSGNGNTSLLDSDWKALGLSGQQIGWLGVPYSGD